MRKWLWGVGFAVVGVGAYAGWKATRTNEVAPAYRTVPVERRAIVQEVRATGIVQPIRAIDIGTQVNGRIVALHADFNTHVKAGDVIAQIDPAVYEAALARDEASLLSSRASVEQTKARLALAEKTLERASGLATRQMIPEAELDQARADRDVLRAQLQMAEASVRQAEASAKQSRANLDYTTIKAPVAGVVISRDVSEGQTVVSSMSAQKLFSIATDLRRVQVEASIPEADIGRVKKDQRVVFTVDAYEQVFTGVVAQVRLAAATVQNVVTYPVIVEADNPDELLFPGMTASLACEVARSDDAVVVPNAALRFVPPADGGANGAGGGARRANGTPSGPRVWRQGPDSAPAAVSVRTGLTDGSATQLLEADSLLGTEVIVGMQSAAAKAGGVKNPFAPQLPNRRVMGGGPRGRR